MKKGSSKQQSPKRKKQLKQTREMEKEARYRRQGNVYELSHVREQRAAQQRLNLQRPNMQRSNMQRSVQQSRQSMQRQMQQPVQRPPRQPARGVRHATAHDQYRRSHTLPSAKDAKHVSRTTMQRRRSYTSKTLPMFVFAVLLVYLMAQVVVMFSHKSEIATETVFYGTIDTPLTQRALIIRDEYVTKSNRAGTPFYQYGSGAYVKKSAVVCEVKDTQATNDLEAKIDSIDHDILERQKSRSDLSAFAEDVARIEKHMGEVVDLFSSQSMQTDAGYLYSMRSQITNDMNRRNEIWLSENIETFGQLNEEKNAYEKQLAQSMSSVSAAQSGVLALSYDGMEETLTPDKLEEITFQNMPENEEMTQISKVKAVADGDPLFRVVRSNQWYLLTNLPASEIRDWEKGDVYTLDLTTKERTISIPCVVELLQTGEKETKVVFSCMVNMEDFIDMRSVSFSIQSSLLQGIKIPNSAIVEKTLLKIPTDCITERDGKQGVLLANEGKGKFIPINRVTSDDVYSYLSQSEHALKVGDVIIQGSGENETKYEIAKVESKSGVYVANSSMANFVPITILDQNQEFAVVQSNSIYGLQVYDTIVSDAKTITEGQAIY